MYRLLWLWHTSSLGARVEHKSRADFAPEFAPDFKLPLSKFTATDNIMLGNQDWKSSFAMLSNAEQYLAIFYYIYGSLLRRDRQILRRRDILFVLSLQSILFMRRTRFVLQHVTTISLSLAPPVFRAFGP